MTCFSLSCFSLVCYVFCLFDLIFVISYSDYFGFPTFTPSPLSFLPWQLLPVQIVNSSWMEQRSEFGLYNRGQNKEWEIVHTKRNSLSGPNSTATFSLTLFQQLACSYRKHKPLYSPYPILMQSLLMVLTREARRPSQKATISLQDSGNLSLSLPLTRYIPSTNSQHQSFQKPPPEQPEGPDVHNNPSGMLPKW